MKTTFVKRALFILAVIILLAGITAGVTASEKNRNVKSSGNYLSPIADRIDISVKNTEFILKKTSEGAENYTLSFILAVKKTQPDFYAVINSFDIAGLNCENIIFTAQNRDTEGKILKNLNLPAENNKCVELKWQVDLNLSFAKTGVYSPAIELEYTTGITKATAVKKHISIPLSIRVK